MDRGEDPVPLRGGFDRDAGQGPEVQKDVGRADRAAVVLRFIEKLARHRKPGVRGGQDAGFDYIRMYFSYVAEAVSGG